MVCITMHVCLHYQLFLLGRDTDFESTTSALFNELDIDSYFEYKKTAIFSGNFNAISVSTICVFVMSIKN